MPKYLIVSFVISMALTCIFYMPWISENKNIHSYSTIGCQDDYYNCSQGLEYDYSTDTGTIFDKPLGYKVDWFPFLLYSGVVGTVLYIGLFKKLDDEESEKKWLLRKQALEEEHMHREFLRTGKIKHKKVDKNKTGSTNRTNNNRTDEL